MNDPRAEAIAYFATSRDMLWRWDDDGDVLAWSDGITICYREEIIAILEQLAPTGWPSFGALVLLLAAGRCAFPPEKPDPLYPFHLERRLIPVFNRAKIDYHPFEDLVQCVKKFPLELRHPIRARAVLAQTVFADIKKGACPPELYAPVLDVLRSGALTDVALTSQNARHDYEADYAAVASALSRIHSDLLALRLKTGLDDLPQPAPLPVIPAMRMRAMLKELQADPEHAGLARLARDLMAAIQLPRKLWEKDELALGGFSDLANRGNLDRLLLSELAHDDLTLAVRIALGEALYLRREPPVSQPPTTLSVLLDSGVRLWGVPRVMAAAVALALAAKNQGRAECFRAGETAIVPIDLLTRAGLVAHLGCLEAHAHPGLAMADFREHLHKSESVEGILITHRDVLKDPDFQRALALADFKTLYIATVDREGRFEMARFPGAPLCQAQIDLKDLFPKTDNVHREPLLESRLPGGIPYFFTTQPAPLLITVRGAVTKIIESSGRGGLCVMANHRVMRWELPDRGAFAWTSGTQHGVTLCLHERSDRSVCVARAENQRRDIHCSLFKPDGTPLRSFHWRVPTGVLSIKCVEDSLVLFSAAKAETRDLRSGEHISEVDLPAIGSQGRYFYTLNEWRLLLVDAGGLRFEQIHLPSQIAHSEICCLFDRRGIEGPWILARNGDLISHEGKIVLKLDAVHKAQASEDGHRLYVEDIGATRRRLVMLSRMKVFPITGPLSPSTLNPMDRPPERNVSVNFDSIAVEQNVIWLQSRKRVWKRIEESSGVFALRNKVSEGPSETTLRVKFEPVETGAPANNGLAVARWPDGRSAWLDDRGMLHLRCANPRSAEISLMLCEGPVAAWTSDGHWFGPRFFIGDHPASSTTQLRERLRAFSEF